MGRWVNGYSNVAIGRIDLGHNSHGKKRNYFRLCWLNKPSSMENEPDGAKKGQQLACCARGPCFETLGRRTTRPSRVRPLCPSTVNCLQIHMRVLAQSEREIKREAERERERRSQIVWSRLAVNPTGWWGTWQQLRQYINPNCGWPEPRH